MAPKTAEKKVAGKAIAQKKGGKKGGKKRSVESWKIYIYKVCAPCCLLITCPSVAAASAAAVLRTRFAFCCYASAAVSYIGGQGKGMNAVLLRRCRC
jgi:hypothetical protein